MNPLVESQEDKHLSTLSSNIPEKDQLTDQIESEFQDAPSKGMLLEEKTSVPPCAHVTLTENESEPIKVYEDASSLVSSSDSSIDWAEDEYDDYDLVDISFEDNGKFDESEFFKMLQSATNHTFRRIVKRGERGFQDGKRKVSSYLQERTKKPLRRARSFLNKRADAIHKRQAQLLKVRSNLEKKMRNPPILRTIDKIAFLLGVLTMCVTEFFVIQAPAYMPHFYTCLVIPLMVVRFFMYHNVKFHYFMLDWCYFVNLLTLVYLYLYPTSPVLFQALFAVSSGPLAVAIVMWRNSLVFHDLDKLTSIFIHAMPALVVYCVRWWPQLEGVTISPDNDQPEFHFMYGIVGSLLLYTFWQIAYVVKTEYIDREKIQHDSAIMTSARWMTEKKPHPIYLYCVKKGYKGSAVALLVMVQLVYTLLTLLPVVLMFYSFVFHTMSLILILTMCVWHGGGFYFEVFSIKYFKRVQALMKAHEAESKALKEQSYAVVKDEVKTKVVASEKIHLETQMECKQEIKLETCLENPNENLETSS